MIDTDKNCLTLCHLVGVVSQVTLVVAKRPFGDDFVHDAGSHVTYSEVPWQLQQPHLYPATDAAHFQPQPTWTTDVNAWPLPSPPCMLFSVSNCVYAFILMASLAASVVTCIFQTY